MAENLIPNGDFGQGGNGWFCGPGCAIQEQSPCTSQCALVHPPQTLSRLLDLDPTMVGRALNLTVQALASSLTADPKTSTVNVVMTFDNVTTEHRISIASLSENAPFVTYSRNVTLYSISIPFIIHIEDAVGVYDYNLYIQSVSLATRSSNDPPTTTSYSPSEITRLIIEQNREELRKTFTPAIAAITVVIFLVVIVALWFVRRWHLRWQEQRKTSSTPDQQPGQTYELPEAKNQIPTVPATRVPEQEPATVPALNLEPVDTLHGITEVPRSPVEPSPEQPQEHEESSPSIIDDPIGLYASTYRDMISKELEAKLRAANVDIRLNPNGLPEESWLHVIHVGPFELERLKELFAARYPSLNAAAGQESMLSVTSAYPFPRDTASSAPDQLSVHEDRDLAGWAERHRHKISLELQDKLRAACYLPLDDPDRLPVDQWQRLFGVGLFELEILRQLFRERD